MFTTIKTSIENKFIVTDLTRKLNLGPENVIARLAFSYSIASKIKFNVGEIKDSKGKEYSKGVLFGNNLPFYVSLICINYNIYKTDQNIPKYIKMHLDHGLELINSELIQNPSLIGFDFLIEKIDSGLSYID